MFQHASICINNSADLLLKVLTDFPDSAPSADIIYVK